MHKVTEAPPASAGKALSPVGPLLSGRMRRCSLPGPSLLGEPELSSFWCSQQKGLQSQDTTRKEKPEKQKCTGFFKPQKAFLAPDLSNDKAEGLCEEPGSRWFPSLPANSSLHPHSPMGPWQGLPATAPCSALDPSNNQIPPEIPGHLPLILRSSILLPLALASSMS